MKSFTNLTLDLVIGEAGLLSGVDYVYLGVQIWKGTVAFASTDFGDFVCHFLRLKKLIVALCTLHRHTFESKQNKVHLHARHQNDQV